MPKTTKHPTATYDLIASLGSPQTPCLLLIQNNKKFTQIYTHFLISSQIPHKILLLQIHKALNFLLVL